MMENKEEDAFYYYKISTVILNRLGPEAGAIHAIIWGYSRSGRDCFLSEEELGNRTHMSYMRVRRILHLLMDTGYIEKIETKRYNKNKYRIVPGKIEVGVSKENMLTLKSNDAKLNEIKQDRDEYQKELKNINHTQINS